jgi:hypothetical protein
MWNDLRCLNRDFDVTKANKLYLEHLRKMRREYPHLPESLVKKLDLWERHFMGDFSATKEVLILCGLAQRGDFDFEKEDWFQSD